MNTPIKVLSVLVYIVTFVFPSDLLQAQLRCYEYDAAGCRISKNKSCDVACTLIVTSTHDNGSAGTLRKVIECAENGATITIAPSILGQVIQLTAGPLIINKNIFILVSSGTPLILDGAIPIFKVANGSLTLKNVRLFAGCHPWLPGTGLQNYDTTVLEDVTVVESSDPNCLASSLVNFSNMIIKGNTKIILQ